MSTHWNLYKTLSQVGIPCRANFTETNHVEACTNTIKANSLLCWDLLTTYTIRSNLHTIYAIRVKSIGAHMLAVVACHSPYDYFVSSWTWVGTTAECRQTVRAKLFLHVSPTFLNLPGPANQSFNLRCSKTFPRKHRKCPWQLRFQRETCGQYNVLFVRCAFRFVLLFSVVLGWPGWSWWWLSS